MLCFVLTGVLCFVLTGVLCVQVYNVTLGDQNGGSDGKNEVRGSADDDNNTPGRP